MRIEYTGIGIRTLCELFGKTRLAYYDHNKREHIRYENHIVILELITIIRKDMPRIGTKKLYHMISPTLERECIKIGRDLLHQLLVDHSLTVRVKRKYVRTTWSDHWLRKYPNLIKGLIVDAPNQLWVSDITYIRLVNDFSYLSLITDAYSRKIVGYCLSTSLGREGTVSALVLALSKISLDQQGLIHHSDRGVQYCSADYVDLLSEYNAKISMTENGDPRENAIAERVNGILKVEMGLGESFTSHQEALQAVDKEIHIYNSMRPHSSCDYLTPDEAHYKNGKLKMRWKRRSFEKKFPSKEVYTSLEGN